MSISALVINTLRIVFESLLNPAFAIFSAKNCAGVIIAKIIAFNKVYI